MIEFQNISKTYKPGHPVVTNLNLHVNKGEILVLIGPSGCGKTTTMKMVNRLVEPTAGKILINGEDISSQNPVELRKNIGYVIQNIGLLPHMTIAENVALVPKLKGWNKADYLQRVDELLCREVAQQRDRDALGALGGKYGVGVGLLLRQVERHGVDLEKGFLAHSGAVSDETCVTQTGLVLELDAGHFDGLGNIQRQRGDDCQNQCSHHVSLSKAAKPRMPLQTI